MPFQCVRSKILGENVMGWKTVRVINSLLCLDKTFKRRMLEKSLEYLVNPLEVYLNKEGVYIRPVMTWPKGTSKFYEKANYTLSP